MYNLNKEQKKAVEHTGSPLLIVAGAGTGKTMVITQKIAWLIEQGLAKSDEILALAFTEKAAGEMVERVDKLLPYGYVDLWIMTFHGFAEKILQQHGLDIGLPTDFKLLNEFSQWALIKKNLDKFELDYYRPLGNQTKFIGALIKHFSRAKDEDISPEQYLKYAEELQQNLDNKMSGATIKTELKGVLDLDGEVTKEVLTQEVARISEVANAYHVYQQLLLDNNALDFGDLINYTLKLFRERPAILAKFRQKFKYILVDEFQDTNWSQYELIKLLTGCNNVNQDKKSSVVEKNQNHPPAPSLLKEGEQARIPGANLTVVGDDDQCLPGNSMILTKKGKKRIDKIKAGEEIATAVGKGYLSYSKVNFVNRNRKQAKLLTFTTKRGYKITTTDNHKMFCFIPQSWDKHNSKIKENQYYYVYLMYKQGVGWRLGITKDLVVRLKLERTADKIVAIKSFTTEEEARYNEALLSLKYGIPTVCFCEREGIMTKNKWAEKLYQDLNIENNVKKLANDLNIDLEAHQVCLDGVNRGSKVRIKINLEMCHRNYRSKYAKGIFLQSPQVIHLLTLETSHKPTLEKLKRMNFKLSKAKRGGKRLRISSTNLEYLGKLAKEIQQATDGIIENKIKVGKTNIVHKKSLIIPASNLLEGMFVPTVTDKGVIYDQIIKREEKNKTLVVYDLEVEKTHNFIANDIVVHNSIFRFRGASMSNILQFKKDYLEAEEVVLVDNYRSKQNILDCAYSFIQLNNPNRLEYQLNQTTPDPSLSKEGNDGNGAGGKIDKKLVAQEGGQGVIEVVQGEDLHDEVNKVIEKIAELKVADKDASWNDFAILVRANNSAKEFVNALEIAGLPYIFLASKGLYSRSVIMDIIAYLKLLDNYHESTALYRIINLPVFKFSHEEVISLFNLAKKKTWSLYETLKYAMNFEEAIAEKAKNVIQLVEKHTAVVREKNVSEIINVFLEDSGYLKHLSELAEPVFVPHTVGLRRGEQKVRETMRELNQFMKRVKEFEADNDDKSVKNFLAELDLEIESGEEGGLAPDAEVGPEMIKVLTVHAAKGLEFKYVFIVNMVDLRFPTTERKDPILLPDALVKEILPTGDVHLQEERRLFYVAMTRSKCGLYFSWAEDYGGTRRKKPSRFLEEVGLENLVNSEPQAIRRGKQSIVNREDIRELEVKKEVIQKIIVSDFKYQLPSYYSYTQLAAYENCPWQYRYAHILKIPRKGKAVFSFGQTMHVVLQKFFGLIIQSRNIQQESLFNEMNNFNSSPILSGREEEIVLPKHQNERKQEVVSLDELLRLYEESWVDDWYESKEQKEEYRKKGREILKEFYNKHTCPAAQGMGGEDNWPKVQSLEQGIRFKLDNYTILGKIDRVDDVGESGIRIVDYKTGTPKVKDKLSLDDKEQLLIYQMAAEQAMDKKVSNLQFYYLDNNSEVSFLGSGDEIKEMREKVVNKIKKIEESIKNDNFPPKPGVLCKFCDFREICEFRQL